MRRIALALCWLAALATAAFAAWGTPTSVGTANNSSGSSIAISGATAPGGALLVVIVTENSGALGSLSDSSSNTYNLASSEIFNSGTGIVGLYYVNGASALSSGSITYSKHGTGKAAISAFYVTGGSPSFALDSAATATAAAVGYEAVVTSGTASNSGELFVGATGCNGAVQTQAPGWSSPPNSVSCTAWGIVGGTQVNASNSPLTYNPSYFNVTDWGAIIVAFNQAAAVKPFVFVPGPIP